MDATRGTPERSPDSPAPIAQSPPAAPAGTVAEPAGTAAASRPMSAEPSPDSPAKIAQSAQAAPAGTAAASRPMSAEPPPALVVRIARWGLRIVGVALAVEVALLATESAGASLRSTLIGIAFFASGAIGLLCAGVVVGYTVFVRAHARLGEVLATLWASAILTALFLGAFKTQLRRENLIAVVTFGVLVFLGFGVGSTWGWGTARRLGEERTGVRFGLLAAGWAGAAGMLFLLYAIAVVIARVAEVGDRLPLWPCPLALLVCVPILAERLVRRREGADPARSPARD